MERRQRLLASTREVTENIERRAERDNSVLHPRNYTALLLPSPNFCATDISKEVDEEMSDSIDLLSTSPFLAVAHCVKRKSSFNIFLQP